MLLDVAKALELPGTSGAAEFGRFSAVSSVNIQRLPVLVHPLAFGALRTRVHVLC